ncbi:tyrosine-protein phosphatase [Cardinium endosymbiont of Tipula unca]|uniref:tyrosine-protein phosphatase n=1 Tax=Cardinium endosymbiont of Tipula unca TaxID=3066216 RepID=UPI0030CEE312
MEQTERIVGESSFMYLPISAVGALTSPKFKDHVNKLIKETVGFYNTTYPKLCESLNPDTLLENKEALQAQINDIKDLQDKAYFNRLSPLKQSAVSADWKNTYTQNKNIITDNYYANIATNYITCKTMLAERRGKSDASVLFSCKSGKDRTGVISYLVDGSIICANNPALNPTATYKALACASHVQILASLNGGMPGRFGMKPVSLNQIARDAQTSGQLFPRTAHWTNIPLN